MNRQDLRTAEAQWRASCRQTHRKTVPMQGTRPKQPVLKWAKRVAIVVCLIVAADALHRTQLACEINGLPGKHCTD